MDQLEEQRIILFDAILNSVQLPPLPPIPNNLLEAISPDNPYRDKWYEASLKELRGIDDYNTLEYAEEQSGRALSTKLIFRVLYTNDYQLTFKVRLGIRGFTQVYGVDYLDTYSPAVSTITLTLLLISVV